MQSTKGCRTNLGIGARWKMNSDQIVTVFKGTILDKVHCGWNRNGKESSTFGKGSLFYLFHPAWQGNSSYGLVVLKGHSCDDDALCTEADIRGMSFSLINSKDVYNRSRGIRAPTRSSGVPYLAPPSIHCLSFMFSLILSASSILRPRNYENIPPKSTWLGLQLRNLFRYYCVKDIGPRRPRRLIRASPGSWIMCVGKVYPRRGHGCHFLLSQSSTLYFQLGWLAAYNPPRKHRFGMECLKHSAIACRFSVGRRIHSLQGTTVPKTISPIRPVVLCRRIDLLF